MSPQKGLNRLKLAKTVISSFIFKVRRIGLVKNIKGHHKIFFEVNFTVM